MGKKIAVRGGTVIQRSAASGNIHFLCHKAVPDLMKYLRKLRFLLFQAQIRHTRIKVIGPYRMADNPIVFLKRKPILIVIQPLLYGIPESDRLFQKLQIIPITCGTVQLRQPHIMRRADCGLYLPAFLRPVIQIFQIARRLSGDGKKAVFPCHPFIQTGGSEQMPEIINLEVIDISQTGCFSIPFPYNLLG